MAHCRFSCPFEFFESPTIALRCVENAFTFSERLQSAQCRLSSLKVLNGLCRTILHVVQGCEGTSDFGCDFLKLVDAVLKETIRSLSIFSLL